MRRPRQQDVPKGGRRTLTWNDSTCSDFVSTLRTALNWAVEAGHLSKNPLQGLKRRAIRSRGAQSVITPEQHARVMGACRSAPMRDLLAALQHTGARPGELLAATAADWDDARGAFVFLADTRRSPGRFRHKSARKKDRVIYFTGNVLEMVRRRVREHPQGPVFCNGRGRAFTIESVRHHFRKLRGDPALRHVTPYGYRHGFATRWLLAGKPIEILAELLGNTPEQIRLHYAHLCGDPAAIRGHLEAFMERNGSSPPPAGPEAAPERPAP
jgi:integrase